MKKQVTPKKQTPVKKTADSTAHFLAKAGTATQNVGKAVSKMGRYESPDTAVIKAHKVQKQAIKDVVRQGNKGRVGYDANGYPAKKKK